MEGVYYCEICSNEDDNPLNKEEIYLEDWLSIDGVCSRCLKNGCSECLGVCYVCCNKGRYDVICKKCQHPNELVKVCKCGWLSCKKHNKKECGQCKANRNYNSKYS
jgi:hypothetical protein